MKAQNALFCIYLYFNECPCCGYNHFKKSAGLPYVPLLHSSHLLSFHCCKLVCQGKGAQHLFSVTVLKDFSNVFRSCIDNFHRHFWLNHLFFCIPPVLFSSFSPVSASASLLYNTVCQRTLPLKSLPHVTLYMVHNLHSSLCQHSCRSPSLHPFSLSMCYIFCDQTALCLLPKFLLVLLISETAHQALCPCFVKAIRDQFSLSAIYRKPCCKFNKIGSIFRWVMLNENSRFRVQIFIGWCTYSS